MEKTPFPATLDELETYPQQTLTAEQVAQFLGCSVQSIRFPRTDRPLSPNTCRAW